MTPFEAATIDYSCVDGIATVTLNRPERRNAVSWQLIQDLIAVIEHADNDDDLRVLVITGSGSDFCVGADLAADKETRTLRGRSIAEDNERLTAASAAVEALVSFGRPTIAAINGACAGAGLSLALATDIRIAADRAVFNTAFVTAGLSGDFGSAWLLTRTVGAAAAALLMAPRKLDAAEAHRLGLVNETADDVRARSHEMATRLASQAPVAVANAKRNLIDAQRMTLGDYLRHEVPRMVECANTTDAREAALAFLEKRAPEFTGS